MVDIPADVSIAADVMETEGTGTSDRTKKQWRAAGGRLSNAIQTSPDLFNQASLVRHRRQLCFFTKKIGLPLPAKAGPCLD